MKREELDSAYAKSRRRELEELERYLNEGKEEKKPERDSSTISLENLDVLLDGIDKEDPVMDKKIKDATERFKEKLESGYFDNKELSQDDVARMLAFGGREEAPSSEILSEDEIDIIVEDLVENNQDELFDEHNGVTIKLIAERILDVGLHYVLSRKLTYSEFVNGKSQVSVPKGYRLVTLNYNNSMIHNNYAVFENVRPVKVKVYKTEDGREISPEFGVPLS